MNAIEWVRHFADASLGVGILVMLVLLLRRPTARLFGPQAAYLLWIAPAIRLFLPEFAVLPAPETQEAPFFYAFPAEAAPVHEAQPNPAGAFNIDLVLTAAFFLWAAVSFAWANMIFAAQRASWRRLMTGSSPAPAVVVARAENVARRIGYRGPVDVRMLDADAGPMTAGLFRPKIFLPAKFEADYSEDEQTLALAHEIAHLARGDLFALLAASLLRVVQWPNPLVHVAFRAYRSDQEAACDAFVMEKLNAPSAAAPYASAILKSARSASAHPHFALALAHPVKERLMLLKNRPHSPARRALGLACACVVAATGLAATANYGYAADEKKKKTETVIELSSSSKNIITADDGEVLIVEGLDDETARKIVFIDENGERKLKVTGFDGEVLVDKKYADGDQMPFSQVFVEKNGRRTGVIKLSGDSGQPAVFNFTGADDADLDCFSDGEDGEVSVFEWRSVQDDVSGDLSDDEETKVVTKRIVCERLNGENASPEKRADRLRQAIIRLEEAEKRSAERRRETIERLKAELQELEKSKN